ncbi:MAG: alpha-E domain-containing protein [Ardenticatenaceae bacterium]|nr:alpha-E domain-containing protein [Anaerolineales bacterium]MCB8977985.1 alpha-E domain-containing protein [Ardenticatenaceae bacterium]
MLSRVADSLYWLSRYLERAEHTARLTSVYFDLILDQSSQRRQERYHLLLHNLKMAFNPEEVFDPDKTLQLIALDETNSNSIISCVTQARENARQVREQLSSETWLQINQLYLIMKRPYRQWRGQPQVFMQQIIQQIHLISGISDATMNHDEGWQFMQLGNYLERAMAILRLINVQFLAISNRPPHREDYLDWIALLKSCTAFEAYCKVYTADLLPPRIAEFLLLNAEFPHSLHFSVNMVRDSLVQISHITKSRRNQQLNRRAGRLQSLLQFSQIDEIAQSGLPEFLQDVKKQCMDIHDAIYQVYISFPVAEELPA